MFIIVEQNSMKNLIIIISCLILSLFSCKPKQTNQKINKKREGLWVEQYTLDSAHYKSVGKYENNDPVKKWRYYLDGKIIKKERRKGNTCCAKFYHKNGKIQSRGLIVLDTSTKYAHWYYSGNWKFYNDKGKLLIKRNYYNGKLVSETILK